MLAHALARVASLIPIIKETPVCERAHIPAFLLLWVLFLFITEKEPHYKVWFKRSVPVASMSARRYRFNFFLVNTKLR